MTNRILLVLIIAYAVTSCVAPGQGLIPNKAIPGNVCFEQTAGSILIARSC